MTCRKNQKGTALLISMIVLGILAAWAVSINSICGANLQLAENQHKANAARACAESGLDIVRYWISSVSIDGTTESGLVFVKIVDHLQDDLAPAFTVTYDGSSIIIPNVTLDADKQQSFSAAITPIDAETLQVDVTGHEGSIDKTIRVNYAYGTRTSTVFDFGVATKGPLHLAGNIELTGINVSVEASVYIESPNSTVALTITGNSQIAGDVSITNPLGTIDLEGGQASIAGETDEEGISEHVFIGVPSTEFPTPDPDYFEPYATNIVDSNTDTTSDATFENIRIVAGTNPVFSGSVVINGIVYIETPNIVTFTGNVDITGIVVGDGDIQDDSGTNEINFLGSVASSSVTELPDEEQFADLRDETGTFVMAPGFDVSFGGSFDTLNGAIAASGINFFGDAGGVIEGSVINYSDDEMTLAGNSDLSFNRSGITEMPAGFVPEIILEYNPASYSEIII